MKKLFLVFLFSGSILCRFPFVSALAADDKPEPMLSDAEKIYGLSLFWKEVSYNFANFAHVSDLDWDMTYQEFIPRAVPRDVLGYTLAVAALEDVLRGKVWAYSDSQRRKSKRQKDLADILRVIETHPELKDQVPPEIKAQAE